MNWKKTTKNCITSDDDYLISKYALEHGHAYVSRSPAPASKILHSGTDLNKAKAACVDHFELTRGKAA